jgi:hypothetical protein
MPNNSLIERIGLALNGLWLLGYILTIMTALFGGIHIIHRSRN